MDRPLPPKPWYVKYRYYVLGGAAFAACVVYVSVLALRPREVALSDPERAVADVVEGDFLEYVEAEGVVTPIQTVQVNALEGGFVERIVAEEGAMLEVGDTIVILTNPDLTRTIDDERAEWQNSQRNYQEQEIEMAQRSLTLRQQVLDAEHQMGRLGKGLAQSREEFRMGVRSRAELEVEEEEYEYQLKKTELQMQGLRHDSVTTLLKRDMIKASREAADRRLDRATERAGKLVVRAAVAGQLSFLNATLGQQVGAGSEIGKIKVLSEYKLHTQLSEYYIDRIATGLDASVQYQKDTFALRVSRVVPEVRDRQFACDLNFTGATPGNIRLGKSYRVSIELDRPERAVVVPRGDFYQHTAGAWIYKLSDDGRTARRTEVEIGRQNPRQYEVLGGLKPGDRVIVNGYEKLGTADEVCLKN